VGSGGGDCYKTMVSKGQKVTPQYGEFKEQSDIDKTYIFVTRLLVDRTENGRCIEMAPLR